MAIQKRNLLCLINKENLELGQKLLYDPYKGILVNFVELATDKDKIDFDPVSKAFNGLLSISQELRHYYESLLGVTSYFQASKGGRGRYIEKKFSSAIETCSLDIKLSNFPTWLTNPVLYRKRGIFTIQGLTRTEKAQLRTTEWDWIGADDQTTDLGNYLANDNTIVLVELKNRTDSGGTSARREIWTNKFGALLDLIFDTVNKLYRRGNNQFSLLELLNYFEIRNIEIYLAILFNVDGSPASVEGDRSKGFYSSSVEGYRELRGRLQELEESNTIEVIREDSNCFTVTFEILQTNNISVTFGSLYGDQVSAKLFRDGDSITDLLLLRYDDIWLSLLTVIFERTLLLKHNQNCMTKLRYIMSRDHSARILYENTITSEGTEASISSFVNYLIRDYASHFPNTLVPSGREKDEYIGDVVQVLAASES